MTKPNRRTGNGRDQRGRFAQGNPGGPGRKPRATEAEYLDATLGAVPLDRWQRVVAKALDLAEKGDAKARDWLGRILVGDRADAAEASRKLREVETPHPVERERAILSDAACADLHLEFMRIQNAIDDRLTEIGFDPWTLKWTHLPEPQRIVVQGVEQWRSGAEPGSFRGGTNGASAVPPPT